MTNPDSMPLPTVLEWRVDAQTLTPVVGGKGEAYVGFADHESGGAGVWPARLIVASRPGGDVLLRWRTPIVSTSYSFMGYAYSSRFTGDLVHGDTGTIIVTLLD